jgi:hypothetical protein
MTFFEARALVSAVISLSATQASTVPAQVRKSFAVKSCPEISFRYAFTSPEPIFRRWPFSSMY